MSRPDFNQLDFNQYVAVNQQVFNINNDVERDNESSVMPTFFYFSYKQTNILMRPSDEYLHKKKKKNHWNHITKLEKQNTYMPAPQTPLTEGAI